MTPVSAGRVFGRRRTARWTLAGVGLAAGLTAGGVAGPAAPQAPVGKPPPAPAGDQAVGHKAVPGQGAGEPLPLARLPFERLQKLIKPAPDESYWSEVPWLIDLAEARRRAAAAGKPLVVWSMAAEPLGHC